MPELTIPEEYRFAPGVVFDNDNEYQDNPRRRHRRNRARVFRRGRRIPPQFLKHPPRSWRKGRKARRSRSGRRRGRRFTGRYGWHRPSLSYGRRGWRAPRRSRLGIRGYRVNRRRHRRNPRFGRHRPVLYHGRGYWRAGRRSRIGIRGHRVNRRHRRNPTFGGGGKWYSLPHKGDFGHGWKANAGAAVAFIGGLAIPGLTGYAYNMAFDKWLADPVGKLVGDNNTTYVKTASRLGLKLGVGALSAYAVHKLAHKPHLARVMWLGSIIGVILDGIASLASYTIGYNNPFGKAIVMRGGTPKVSAKSVALNAFGLGEVAQAYGTYRDANLAKGGVRIMQHPSGQMGLYAPGKGLVMTGKPAAVLGRYHTIMSARARGMGEMISVEAGMRGAPWIGDEASQ
jgi:hypothetical protein